MFSDNFQYNLSKDINDPQNVNSLWDFVDQDPVGTSGWHQTVTVGNGTCFVQLSDVSGENAFKALVQHVSNPLQPGCKYTIEVQSAYVRVFYPNLLTIFLSGDTYTVEPYGWNSTNNRNYLRIDFALGGAFYYPDIIAYRIRSYSPSGVIITTDPLDITDTSGNNNDWYPGPFTLDVILTGPNTAKVLYNGQAWVPEFTHNLDLSVGKRIGFGGMFNDEQGGDLSFTLSSVAEIVPTMVIGGAAAISSGRVVVPDGGMVVGGNTTVSTYSVPDIVSVVSTGGTVIGGSASILSIRAPPPIFTLRGVGGAIFPFHIKT